MDGRWTRGGHEWSSSRRVKCQVDRRCSRHDNRLLHSGRCQHWSPLSSHRCGSFKSKIERLANACNRTTAPVKCARKQFIFGKLSDLAYVTPTRFNHNRPSTVMFCVRQVLSMHVNHSRTLGTKSLSSIPTFKGCLRKWTYKRD